MLLGLSKEEAIEKYSKKKNHYMITFNISVDGEDIAPGEDYLWCVHGSEKKAKKQIQLYEDAMKESALNGEIDIRILNDNGMPFYAMHFIDAWSKKDTRAVIQVQKLS